MKRILQLSLIISLAALSACQKDLSSDSFVLYSGNAMNDTVWTRVIPFSASVNAIADSTAPEVFIGEFNPTIADTLRSTNGLEISIPANTCVNMNGQSVTDKVKLQITRLQTKGDLLRSLQLTTTDNKRILELTGTFFIKATSGSQEVRIKQNGGIKIRFNDTSDIKNNLSIFTGIESNPAPSWGIDTVFTWNRYADTGRVNTWNYGPGSQSGLSKGYEFIARSFRWFAIGRYIDSAVARTKLSLILPPNYTNKNTIAFAVLKDKRAIITLRADFASRTFAATEVPINTPLTIVSITKIGTQFYLGSKAITDASSSPAFTIAPEKKTVKQLIDFLNTL
jgi:hypothetical protein